MADPHIDRTRFLWQLYLRNEASEAEYRELAAILQADPDAISEQLGEELNLLDIDPSAISRFMADKKVKLVLANIFYGKPAAPVRRIHSWKRWAIAASFILGLGLGTYFLFFNRTDLSRLPQEQRFKNDIAAPIAHKARIKRANGQVIALDTVKNGSLVAEASKVNDGELLYQHDKAIPELLTLDVPRGSRPMKLKLSDGTEVWLNAGSTLTYPTVFTGARREVSMTGEAYFEVAKDQAHQFIVNARNIRTSVLGTHFNIKNYEDEAFSRVTLLEGSIDVNGTKLIPGQQARVAASLEIGNNTDIEEVMAWKNGLFRFNGTDIAAIMRELSRWYDLKVEYKGKTPDYPFVARISRNLPVSKLLKILELTDMIHFEIDRNNITVAP